MNDITKVGETINAKELTETEEKFVQQVIGSTIINGCNFKIYGTIGNPLFIAKDIAEVLGHSHVPTMMQSIDSDEKLVCTILTSGQRRDVNCLTEYGLYELLMQSRKPIAKEFKKGGKKILHELRTKGEVRVNYNIPQTYSEALLLASNQAKQIEEQQKLIEVKDIQIVEMKPKATYYDKVLSSKDSILISVISKDYGLSAVKLNTMLHDYGVQYKRGGTWLPKSKYASSGYTKTTTSHFYKKDGSVGTRVQTEWTQTGRLFIYDLLKSKGILPLMEI